MADIHCIRCGQTRAEIEGIPYGGKIGQELKEKVCNICWKLWYEESIKIINETKISLGDKSGRDFLSKQMKIFFKMEAPPEGGYKAAGPADDDSD